MLGNITRNQRRDIDEKSGSHRQAGNIPRSSRKA